MTKLTFYEKLEEVCETVSKLDFCMLIGDFNAQIGKEECYREITGNQTIHETTNNNGEKLCNLAATLDMFIVSTKFIHRKQHKITWLIPGTNTGNQIDHMLVRSKDCNSINDVRSYRGTNLDTDHILEIAKCKIKIFTQKKQELQNQRKWNLEKMKDLK